MFIGVPLNKLYICEKHYTFGKNISEFYQLDLGVSMMTMQTL